MEQRRVGRSGLTVSRLALGTMSWGDDAHEAAAQLENFVDAGGSLIDTANVYGGAEAILGTLIPSIVPRNDVQIAVTTIGPSGRGPLLSGLDSSLARLGMDSVDLWLVHGFDPAVPFGETCSALEVAVTSGRAAYAGLSGHTAWQAATMATAMTGFPLVAATAEYSLLARDAETDLGPAMDLHGLGLLAWGPLGRGVLTGKYRHGTPADSRGASKRFEQYVAEYRTSWADRIVDAVTTAADGLGVSPLAVAQAWVRDRAGVACAVLGARTATQLRASLEASRLTLPDEIRLALDEISAPDR